METLTAVLERIDSLGYPIDGVDSGGRHFTDSSYESPAAAQASAGTEMDD